jgi:hypothetical protein
VEGQRKEKFSTVMVNQNWIAVQSSRLKQIQLTMKMKVYHRGYIPAGKNRE